ncbi:hypothetical protein BDF20DRAFT_836488 [Mycotypha africana]|uniref:uncharacterized protein n=1 Tax=Mycotypha africana TaxID=64632 RepID=UPI002300CEF6|nr:uncharacterized protein BDF20DRAFT_836488 [Mycotypha africana]KAI8975050.1 hypothetical protein BDF20DRAFT_836488 [Mycotypha africana]
MNIISIFDPAVVCTFAVSVIVFCSWFTLFYKKVARTERETAYSCALLSSSVTFTCSLPLVYTLLTNGGNLSDILMYRTWTVLATTFFMAFLFLDLILGSIFYRNKLEWLTSWVHHIVYLGTLTWAIHQQYCSIFIMMCSLELPTFLLALGSVRSQFRRDYLFATAFVSTRIIFHAYAIRCAYRMDASFNPIVMALSAFFPIHCFWFYGFIKQQIRLAKQRKAGNKAVSCNNEKTLVPSKQRSVTARKITSTMQKATTKAMTSSLNKLNQYTNIIQQRKGMASNTVTGIQTRSASSYLRPTSPTSSFQPQQRQHTSPPVSVH